jgi:hypothetical protein
MLQQNIWVRMRMAKKPSKPKMGRPALPPGKRRGASMGFRPTPGIRGKLEEAAKANGRSMSQEIESRLERSFVEFGREDIFLVARLLATAIQTIEAVTGKIWMDDAGAHKHTQETCRTILDAFRPPGIDVTESSTIGADAATDAVLSVFNQGAKAARLRKKKGG